MDKILIAAIFTEAVWETLKMIKKDKYFCFDRIGAIAVAALICIVFDFDVFTMYLGANKIPFVGNILTGILISRGSNFVHDLLGSISSFYQQRKNGNHEQNESTN
ncbi:hypothetical protein ABG79_02307 [Caloramator mitchellensis]|uniref:Uncharacterized protein n=1 Tax=Caloramator mitchellensis TaxID=908809 RepID=A0A0R3JUM5_CALMK|nr:hypothetical protein [Caloramator mitchellensis]KRQ85933.1 hypothetical protein ABG79_02307 [Caloramator mitchellensis]